MSKYEESLSAFEVGADLDIQHIDYDPTGQPNSENAIRKAELQNLEVMFPTSHELFIDLDNEISFQMFTRQLQIFQKFIDSDIEWEVAPSRSGLPKRHATVWLSRPVKDEVERILFQVLLGSDRVREMLGYVQATSGDPHPTLFLETKVNSLTGTTVDQKLLTSGSDIDILKDEDIPF